MVKTFEEYPRDVQEKAMVVIARVTGQHPKCWKRKVSQHKKNLEYLKKTLN